MSQSLNQCNDGHAEVCFVGNKCPVCEEMEGHKDDVESLKDEIKSLKDQVSSLQDEVNSIREPIIAALDTTHKYLEKGQPNEPKS